ncbi:unnamed protein product, partial [Medioppia subpectinata]
MAQRSFPPSFWNINHQPVLSHHHTGGGGGGQSGLCLPGSSSQVHELYADAYHHPSALHPASIHHQTGADPWHYTLSAAAAATASNPYSAAHHHHHHRAAAIHELSSYSAAAATNRFNTAPYSSLLLQPASMRSTRLTPVSATCTASAFDKSAAVDVGAMSWPTNSRYHHDQQTAAMNFAAGIDPSNYSASAAYGAAMSAAMSVPDIYTFEQLTKIF